MSLPNDNVRRKLSPAEVASLWGVGLKTVWGWVKSGQLRAINAGVASTGRPRFLIDVDDLEAFERSREVTPSEPTKTPSRRRRKRQAVTEFFPD